MLSCSVCGTLVLAREATVEGEVFIGVHMCGKYPLAV